NRVSLRRGLRLQFPGGRARSAAHRAPARGHQRRADVVDDVLLRRGAERRRLRVAGILNCHAYSSCAVNCHALLPLLMSRVNLSCFATGSGELVKFVKVKSESPPTAAATVGS